MTKENCAIVVVAFFVLAAQLQLASGADPDEVIIRGKVSQFDIGKKEYAPLSKAKIGVFRGGSAVLPQAELTGNDGTFEFAIRNGTPFRLVFFKDLHWVPEVTPPLNGVETPQSFEVTMRTVDDYRASEERLSLRTKMDTLYDEFRTEKKGEFSSLLEEMRFKKIE